MLITTPAESTTTRRTCPQIIAATTSLGGTGMPDDGFAAPLTRIGRRRDVAGSVEVGRSRVGTSMHQVDERDRSRWRPGRWWRRVRRSRTSRRSGVAHPSAASTSSTPRRRSGPASASQSAVNSASQNRSKISAITAPCANPPRRVQMDLLADFGDPGPTTLMGRLGGLVGAVQVGEHLPPPHGDAELVMRQLGGVVDHHLSHIDQL